VSRSRQEILAEQKSENRIIAMIVFSILAMFLLGGTRAVLPIGLGIFGSLALISVYEQMPKWLRKTMARFHVIIDFASGFIIYKMFGTGTATALFGSALCSLLTSIYLIREKRRFVDAPKLERDAVRNAFKRRQSA